MSIPEIFKLDLGKASDRQLDQAWLEIGKAKLEMRRSLFTDASGRPNYTGFKQIRSSLQELNLKLNEIWDEIFSRQVKPYYLRRNEPFHWLKGANPLRWDHLPSVTDFGTVDD